MYQEGLGVPQNDTEAMAWFIDAAYQKNIMAQYYLGAMYFEGIKVDQDFVQAYAWIGIVAAGGYKQAEKLRDKIEAYMTVDERKEGHTLAKELWEKHGVTQNKNKNKKNA